MSGTFQSITLLALFALSLTGCSTVEVAAHKVLPETDHRHPATRCLCLWQQAEGQTETGATARGFGGQVYFFTADSETPVTVDGTIDVFLFDDHGSVEEQARPIYEARFASHEWQAMRHESQLGPVYSLFIPYPRAGHYEANCSLRIRLTRPDGSRLFSEMTAVKLVGQTRPERDTQVHSIDPRREQQWSDEDAAGEQRPTYGETIAIQRDGRLMTTASPRPDARSTEIRPGNAAASPPNPELDARVNYYENKLKALMRQKAERQATLDAHPPVIEQTAYEPESPRKAAPRDRAPREFENPFYSY